MNYNATDTERPYPDAAAIRAQVMEGLAPVMVFAEAVGRSKRTVDAWIAQGIPTAYIGNTPYIQVAPAREWLLKPRVRQPAARSPGRPRKAA